MTLYFHLDDEPSEDKHPFIVRLGRLTFRIRRTRTADLHGSDLAAAVAQDGTQPPGEQAQASPTGTAEAGNAVPPRPDAREPTSVDLDELVRLDLRHLEPSLLPARRRKESIEQLNL